MGRATLLSLVAVVLALVAGAVAQIPQGTCQPFAGAPLSQCSSVVDYDVFVPANLTQSDIDALAAEQTSLFFLGATSSDCSDAALRFICAEAFRQCYEIPIDALGNTIALPSPTCFASCYRFTEECEDTLEELGVPVTDCNTESELTGQPTYPQDALVLQLAPGTPTITLPCNNPSLIASYTAIPPATCEPFAGAPLSGCNTVISHDVYIPEGFTQSDLDALAAESAAALKAGIVHQDCMEAGMRFVCTQAFRKCFEEVVSEEPLVSVLLPESTCQSLCDGFNNRCEADFKKLGLPFQDCDALSPTTGLPEFPVGSTEFPLGADITLNIPCMNDRFTMLPSFTFIPFATCEKLRPTTESQCSQSGVLDDYKVVYVVEGSSQAELDREALASTYAVSYPLTPDECTTATYRFACLGVYLGCEEVPLAALPGAKVVLPVPPCKSVCETVAVDCKSTLELAGRDPPDCEETTSAGLPLFPEETFSLTVGDQIISFPCNLPPDDDVDVDKTCPSDFTDEDDDCGFPCPVPVYSDGRYTALKIVITYGAILSLVTSVILIMTYVFDKTKRAFPVNMPLWISLAALGYAIGFLMGPIFGFERIVCDSTPLCRLQAVLLLYFQYAMAAWMMVLAFNICLTLIMQLKFRKVMSKKQKIILQVIYHVVCWGVGMPPCIVGLAVDKLDYVPPSLICFTSADPDGWPIIGLYTIPIFIILCLTVFFTLLVIIGIWKVSVSMEKGFNKMKFVKALLEQWRIFLFLAVFLYIYLYNIEESIRASITYDDNVEGFEDWGACVFANGDDEDCDLDTKLVYALSLLFAINTSLQGFFVNVIFLTSPSTFIFWRDRVIYVAQGKGFYGDPDESMLSNKSFHSTRG